MTAAPALIRPEEPGDGPAIRQVNLDAFEGDGEARLVEALRATARPFVSLVAEAEGCVAGHIAFSPVTVDGMDHGALGLAPMAVAPAHQRRGIGGALMRAGLAACRAAGAPFVVVLGDPAYYGRFGFVPAAHHGLRCEYDVPAGAFQVQALRPGALDGVRGLVRYHTAFATL